MAEWSTVRERVLGSQHPDTFANMATLADILRDGGNVSAAESPIKNRSWVSKLHWVGVIPKPCACFTSILCFGKASARTLQRDASPSN